MIELAMLGLVFTFVNSYIAHQEKIQARKLYVFWFTLIGLAIGLFTIHLLFMNLYSL